MCTSFRCKSGTFSDVICGQVCWCSFITPVGMTSTRTSRIISISCCLIVLMSLPAPLTYPNDLPVILPCLITLGALVYKYTRYRIARALYILSHCNCLHCNYPIIGSSPHIVQNIQDLQMWPPNRIPAIALPPSAVYICLSHSHDYST